MSFDGRLVVYSAQDAFLFELSPNEILKALMVEEINAEHSLTLVTTRTLEKEQRILNQDKTGRWREFVVSGCRQTHGGSSPFKEYKCVWSLQHDFRLFGVDVYIDDEYGMSASSALQEIVSNTSKWSRGTVTLTTTSSADMTQTDGWTALSKLVTNWVGEVDATITVGSGGVVSRSVDLYAQMGNQTARRRFDYARDMTQIDRKVDEMPIGCRIRPYGAGERTIDGINEKITIEDVNDGKDYLQNDDIAPYMRFPDGNGGYEYPTVNVENSSINDEEELLEWAESVLEQYTTPLVTYEANVLQYEEAGANPKGLALGDAVQCVDFDFFDGAALRMQSRARRIERDLLDHSKTVIRIGNVRESLVTSVSGAIQKANESIGVLAGGYTAMAEYLDNILDNLNMDINAIGGYAYLTDGEGIVTYDIAVDDPLIGYNSASQTWASKVVQIKGGSIRIADEKNSSFAGINDWKWKTVFVSGHVAAELITAAQITAGYIGNADSKSYWDIDNGEMVIRGGQIQATIGSTGTITSNVMWKRFAYTQGAGTVNSYGFEVKNPHTNGGWIGLFPALTDTSSYWGSLIASGEFLIAAMGNNTSNYGFVKLTDASASMSFGSPSAGTGAPALGVSVTSTGCQVSYSTTYSISVSSSGTVIKGLLSADTGIKVSTNSGELLSTSGNNIYIGKADTSVSTRYVQIRSHAYFAGSAYISGGLSVSGTKSRVAGTENYGERKLYAYETPTPMFGDLGSARTDEEGTCIVSIDDLFAEASRTDISYQVFLQKCGEGDVWVSEKSATHFVVRGTPDMPFDWEVKAVQRGYETLRIDDVALEEMEGEARYHDDLESLYEDELNFIEEMEEIYEAA